MNTTTLNGQPYVNYRKLARDIMNTKREYEVHRTCIWHRDCMNAVTSVSKSSAYLMIEYKKGSWHFVKSSKLLDVMLEKFDKMEVKAGTLRLLDTCSSNIIREK